MTYTNIILKALQIANANGYDTYYAEVLEDFKVDIGGLYLDNDEKDEEIAIRDIIFDIEFAQAFWGEEKANCGCHTFSWCEECFLTYKWEYHLQQMILKEKPLKYLEKFL